MTDSPLFSSFPSFPSADKAPAPAAPAPTFSSFPEIFAAPAKDKGQEGEKKESKERDREKSEVKDREKERDREREKRGSRRDDRERNRERDDGHDGDRERERNRKREKDRTSHRDDKKQSRDTRHSSSGRDKDRERERDRDRRKRDDREKSTDAGRDHERERDSYRRRDRDRDREREHGRERDRERESGRDRDRPRERDRDERRKEIEERRERERRKARDFPRGAGDEIKRSRSQDGNDDEKDDGVPWYEAGTSKKARLGDEAPFDPTAPSVAFVDTVGDKDVLRYGATSSFTAPRYRRDQGRVLGLSNGLRIVYSKERTQKGVEIAPLGRPYIPRYSSRVIDGTASRHLARILMRPTGASASDLTESFTPFDVPRLKDREEASDLPAYRAIAKEKDGDSDEEELAAIQAALGTVSTLDEDIRKRTAEYERHLRAEPSDIDSWLAYSRLHLQLSPEAAPAPGVDPTTQPTNRANADMTLAILARALDHAPNFASTTLHRAYLRCAESFWPLAKVTERWENVIRALSDRAPEEDMMALYLGYIEWREGQGIGQTTEGTTGGVDEVVDVYLECLRKLNTGTVRDQEAREENQVYLVLRACLFLKQAGFTERGMAIFQALLEVTFFKPGHLRQPAPPFDREMWFDGVLQEFEDFWDSEVPRLGDPGALGWAASHASREPIPIVTASAPKPLENPSADPYLRWAETERNVSTSTAGRVTDLDAPEDDPFHFVIFSDVKDFLFPLHTPSARLQLIYAVFNFLGLPFSPPGVPTSSASSTDPHLRWAIGENDALRAAFWPPKPSAKRIAWQTVGGAPMEPEAPRPLPSPLDGPVKSWITDRGTLFGRVWFRDMEAADMLHVNRDCARNFLTMLRPLIPDPSFVLSTFAFEAALSPKGAIKLAKTILSEDRDNLALWDGYARLERQRGKVQEARQVYVTALQAAAQRTSTADWKLDENDLWAAWAEMEYEEGEEDRCLEVLVMATSAAPNLGECAQPGYAPTRPSAVALLKARQHFAGLANSSASIPSLMLVTLFTTLTVSIDVARDQLLDIIAVLPDGHPQAEETYQLLTHIIYAHSTRHATPAAIARDVLEKAIAAFPNNTIFLSLYLWGETGGRVYGRVHRLVNSLTGAGEEGGSGAAALMWAVWAEAVSAGTMFWFGGAERVRRALDRAVNSDLGKNSPALWTLYVEFELLQEKPLAAKALMYRALAHNGASKQLYLLAFSQRMRTLFTNRELRALGELIAERGVRVRVQTEAFWEDVDTEDEEESDDDDAGPGEDYEYGLLRDREVLKPY